MGTKIGNQRTLVDMIANRDECKNSGSTLRGTLAENFPGAMGKLPRPYVSMLRAAIEADRLLYVVYSYATPIAWAETGPTGEVVWTMPATRYSVTTTKHQCMIRQAVGEDLVTL